MPAGNAIAQHPVAEEQNTQALIHKAAMQAASMPVPPGVLAPSRPARAAAATAILIYLLQHTESRREADGVQLLQLVKTPTQSVDPQARDDLLKLVEARANQYPVNAARRVAAALPAALVKPESERAMAVQQILEREGRNEQLHIEAQVGRLSAGSNRLRVRAESPHGGYWQLGLRREHCPVCLTMAGKFWPWSVLERLRPQVHYGCGCTLRGLDEALELGLMRPTDVRGAGQALKEAQPTIREADLMHGRLHEALCEHGLMMDPDLYEALSWHAH